MRSVRAHDDASFGFPRRDGPKATAVPVSNAKRIYYRLIEHRRTALMTRIEAHTLDDTLEPLKAPLKFFGEPIWPLVSLHAPFQDVGGSFFFPGMVSQIPARRWGSESVPTRNAKSHRAFTSSADLQSAAGRKVTAAAIAVVAARSAAAEGLARRAEAAPAHAPHGLTSLPAWATPDREAGLRDGPLPAPRHAVRR